MSKSVLSRTAVTNIECGRQRLLVDQLVDIADALGVDGRGASAVGSSAGTATRLARQQVIAEMPTVDRWIKAVKQSST